ncbi:hypothetical protein [Kitasatospora purpeofusca]|uniref:Uncharacterized protein n=1 Tax=Kitasatospora purpeofusca TaxID=67352 RepID=A0ABZ1U059_9ACTN|nr:hypothetical protein [Kitasatospora purpeofusca]
MRTKLVLAGLGVATAGAAFGGIAVAADPTNNITAPYAQAAVNVGANGGISSRTNTVASVSKVNTGQYCVVLTPGIDAGKTIPAATLSNYANWGSEVRVSRNDGACPGNSIRVTTGTNGAAADQPFYLVVP